MSKILFVPDIADWAIGHLVNAKIKYMSHHDTKVIAVHPRDAISLADDFYKQVKEFEPDIIVYEYFRSAEQLINTRPELKKYTSILVHHNQRDKALYHADWNELGIDKIVTHTNKCREKLEAKGYFNVETINHGIDVDFFEYSDKEPEEPIIGYVGRVCPWKGLKEISEVAQELGYKVQMMGKQDKADYWAKIPKEPLQFDYLDCPDEERVNAYHSMTIYVGNSEDDYEEGCYDDKTEVLTDDGWKLFKDVKYENKIATLNPKTEELEYQKPIKLVEYKDKKELVIIKNRAIDIAVTKNHNMWVSHATTGKDRKQFYKDYQFTKAKDLPFNFKIKRNCKWVGNKSKYSDDMIALFGLYIAEGSISSKYDIFLSVSKKEIREKTEKLLKQLGYKFSKRKKEGYKVYVGKEMVQYLKKFGTAPNKYIDTEIKNSTKKQIKIFLEWFAYGDGHMRKGGWREFYSSSGKLIGDIQECLIKIGRNGNINIEDYRGKKRWIVDHWANVNHLSYELNERVQKKESYIRKGYDMSIEKYKGIVYCAEVPNHIMLIRRNGTAYFCGNTLPYLEAMACGVPVVTTLNGVARDKAKHEQNALVVPFKDKEALKKEIKRLMEDKDLRKKLRKNAWNTVKDMTEERMAFEYSKLFYELKYKKPLVSVIIPSTFDRKQEVENILTALDKQIYQPIEAIVVWDEIPSMDEVSPNFYGRKMMRSGNYNNLTVKTLFTNQEGYNLAMARNMGAVEAQGKYLMFNDSRLEPDTDAIQLFVQAIEQVEKDKFWFFGDKGANKNSFVENFSFLRREDFFTFGMMNERINRYGGMSQEIRTRWIKQGGQLSYLPSATAKEIRSSSMTLEKRRGLVDMKFKLFRMFNGDNY